MRHSIIFIFWVIGIQFGCGVKSRPLPPLKDPWISTGEIEKDREKKFKPKRPPPSENRIELQTGDKKEL